MSEAYRPYSQPASISSRSPSRRVSRVLVVVQDAAVGAAADDRVVGDVGLVPMEFVQQLGHHLVLGDAGPGLLHRADVGADGDLRRALHHGRLGPALEQPHVVQRVLQRHELLRAVDAVLGLAAQRVHPADDALVEIVIHAHRVVDPLAALEQARQDVVDVADGEGIVSAEVAHCTLGPGAAAVPGFARRITVAHEQHVLRVLAAGDQHRDRFGFVETGEVVEVAVGPVVVMDIAVALALGRGGNDGDGALAHQLHQLLAAARVLVFTQGHGQRSVSWSVGGGSAGCWTSRGAQCRAVDVVWAARRSVRSS